MPDPKQKVWATRPYEYGPHTLDRGQMFVLRGLPNDEKLTRLGYVEPVKDGETGYPCRVCGEPFIGLPELNAHGQKRHPARPRSLSPDEEDAQAEREEAMLAHVAPLRLDQTAASRA